MQIARPSPSSPGEPEVACADAFASAKWAFAQASRQGAVHAADFALAGQVVRLVAARRALFESLRPAFRHLQVQLAQPRPQLTISVWDAGETGVACPVRPACGTTASPGSIQMSPTARVVSHRGPSWTGWIDRTQREIVVCFQSAGRLDLADRAKPLLELLSIWHFDRRVPLVRAGVVSRNGIGLLMPGNGTNGAAAAALACGLAGFDCLGDGVVGLEPGTPAGIVAHSVYGSTTLEPARIHGFSRPVREAIGGVVTGDGQRLVMLSRLLPRPVGRTAALSAIVVPRRGSGRAGLSPASPGDALHNLVPASALSLPGWRAGHTGLVANAVASLPAYWLDMPPDAAGVPECLLTLC